MLAKDLKDFLCAFNTHNVEYRVVGSYAVGVYSQPRAKKDLDILICVSEENGRAVDILKRIIAVDFDEAWQDVCRA